MVCPKCNSVNNNNAEVCKHCGYRFRRQAPTPQQQSARRSSVNNERKYIIVGSVTLLVLIICLIGGIFAISCMCSNCAACADEADSEYINDSVSGEWQGEESIDIVDESTGEDVVEGDGTGEVVADAGDTAQ